MVGAAIPGVEVAAEAAMMAAAVMVLISANSKLRASRAAGLWRSAVCVERLWRPSSMMRFINTLLLIKPLFFSVVVARSLEHLFVLLSTSAHCRLGWAHVHNYALWPLMMTSSNVWLSAFALCFLCFHFLQKKQQPVIACITTSYRLWEFYR